MATHGSHRSGLAISLLVFGVGVGGALTGCGGRREPPKSAAPAPSAAPVPAASAPHAAAAPSSTAAGNGQPGGAPDVPQSGDGASGEDAELVVSREVVAACPTLRLVRMHMDELDPDLLWLAVLEAIGDCMGNDGSMAEQSIGVSGDEEHRHIVREILGTQGVAPTRVVAKQPSTTGAAECQGASACGKRVEITIVTP